jgi:hypothetical protein
MKSSQAIICDSDDSIDSLWNVDCKAILTWPIDWEGFIVFIGFGSLKSYFLWMFILLGDEVGRNLFHSSTNAS